MNKESSLQSLKQSVNQQLRGNTENFSLVKQDLWKENEVWVLDKVKSRYHESFETHPLLSKVIVSQ